MVLAIILVSLPFYFASFDIPKRIINEAIQGSGFKTPGQTVQFMSIWLPLPETLGGSIQLFQGFQVTQLGLLWGLSGIFLTLVIINGAFKYYINVQKGILGERLLRRMRFVLLDQYLRFFPEDIRGVKPSEAASIIKDEVDPIGGFSGDAFILPAFLSMQALTAVVFILVQSIWLGMVAIVVVLIQAIVVPILRREQLRLTRLRQIESRHLAGEVGEIVETASSIQITGSGNFMRAIIGKRLAILFDIRVQLFKRKFAVKYLNNMLAQVTPFFFYAIGGYLALRGSLDIGQLVAAIAAYRDLPPPIKELIDWDQSRADVVVKYQQITAQFPQSLLPPEVEGENQSEPAADAPLELKSLRVTDKRGSTVLDPLTLTLPRPAHVALVGGAGSGRDVLARVLGRQISRYQGSVLLGPVDWTGLNHRPNSLLMSYAGPEPFLASGTIRDNLLLPLRRQPEAADNDDDLEVRRQRIEAEMSGTPAVLPDERWLDLRLAGASTPEALDDRLLAILEHTGLAEDIYRLGLRSRIDPAEEPELVAKIPALRESIFARLAEKGLTQLVEPLDPDRFNRNATLAENLLFGREIGSRLAKGRFASDPYLRSILEAESLLIPLQQIGLAMAETAIEVFADLAPGDPLFARFSYISAEDMPEFQRIAELVRTRGGLNRLPMDAQARLVELALSYVEPLYRLQLTPPQLQERVLRARKSFRLHLPQTYAADVEFYRPDQYMVSGTLQDNLLFGRVALDAPDAQNRVRLATREALRALGMDREINRLGLAHEVGPSGRFLEAEQRAGVALARALLPCAAITVIDGALGPYSESERRHLLKEIRAAMAGRTLIVTISDPEQAADFDSVLTFDGPRLADRRIGSSVPEEEAAAPPSDAAPPAIREVRHAVQ